MSRRFNNDEVKNSGTGNREARVVLKVKGHQDDSEVHFSIGRSTRLKKLMNAYCLRQGHNFVSFMLNGRLLRGDETADKLEVEEGDEIIAVVHETFHDQVMERNAIIGLLAKTGRMVNTSKHQSEAAMPIQSTLVDQRFNDDEVKSSGTGKREARVVLKVKGHQDGSAVYFSIGRSTKLKKLMNAYCLRQGHNFVNFVLNGRLLRGDETADKLKMKEGDEMKAFVHETFRYQLIECIALAEEKRKDERRKTEMCYAFMAKGGRLLLERIAEDKELKEELRRLWNDGEEDAVLLKIGRLGVQVMMENVEIMEEASRLFEVRDDADEVEDAVFIDIGRVVTELVVGWEELVGGSGEKKLNLISRL